MEEVEEKVEEELKKYTGSAVSIVTKEGIKYTRTEGVSNIDTKTRINEQTKFLVASISKVVTAVGILQLYERNLLNLDTDINQYLSVKVNHPTNIPITTRQLLEHHSGLQDNETGLHTWRYDNTFSPVSLEEHTKRYLVKGGEYYNDEMWSIKPPGECGYHYSNAGFTLLGYLLEQISGQRFIDFMEENIFSPLSLNASWTLPLHDRENIAIPYNSCNQSYGHYCVAEYPSAQLRISISDLSRFLLFFTAGEVDGVKLLRKETVELMCPLPSFTHALGWWGRDAIYGYKEDTAFIHGGFMSGVRTQMNFYPLSSSGFIILTNCESSYFKLESLLKTKMLQLLDQ